MVRDCAPENLEIPDNRQRGRASRGPVGGFRNDLVKLLPRLMQQQAAPALDPDLPFQNEPARAIGRDYGRGLRG
jgi:hypothetical protein